MFPGNRKPAHMKLLQAPAGSRHEMTGAWLVRPPSLREFMEHSDDPGNWRDRPVSELPGSYARAASMLLEGMIRSAVATPGAANPLLPPYLFLWRHHFELQLKAIVAMMNDNLPAWESATGEILPAGFLSKVQQEHSLARLWNAVRPRAETVWSRDDHLWHLPVMTPGAAADLISQLHQIDPNGQGVRYDRDKQNRPTMIGVTRVDLEWAEGNLQGIGEFLAWTRAEIGAVMGVLASEADYQGQRLSEWEAASDDEDL